MNWRKLFPIGDILTAGDRKELEALENGCFELQKAEARILDEWPKDSADRMERLRILAEKYADQPTNENYARMTALAGFPSDLVNGHRSREAVLNAIGRAIEEKMKPEIPIVRRVLSKALEATERELEKQTARERKEADSEGFNYSPSGRVQELQRKVLSLRNEVARQYPHEGAIQHPGGWRIRLADWL